MKLFKPKNTLIEISNQSSELGIRRKNFEEVNLGDSIYWITKQTYHHPCNKEDEDGDEPVFDYKYVIKIMDLFNITGLSEYVNAYELTIHLVLEPSSLCEKCQNEVLQSCDRLDIESILEYGHSIIMLSEYIKTSEDKIVCQKTLSAFNVIECINDLRGFRLDRAINRLGTTGWDMINYFIGKINNPYNFSYMGFFGNMEDEENNVDR